MRDEVRIHVRDHMLTEVWINTLSGWHYCGFPTFSEAFGFLYSWSNGHDSTAHWELRDPPDVEELHRLRMDIEVIRHDEGNANYWAGQDEATAGVCKRWEEALTNPIPKAGVMQNPLEYLYRRTEALRTRADRLAAATALDWRKTPPTPADLNGRSEEYFWIRGGNFNRPLVVRANSGTNSELICGERVFRAEVNFQFFAEGYPETIWSSELKNWPWLLTLEWAGPVERAKIDQPTEQ